MFEARALTDDPLRKRFATLCAGNSLQGSFPGTLIHVEIQTGVVVPVLRNSWGLALRGEFCSQKFPNPSLVWQVWKSDGNFQK